TGVAVAGAVDQAPAPDPGRRGGQGGMQGDRLVALEGRQVRRVQVVPHGDGVEPQVLGALPQVGEGGHAGVLRPGVHAEAGHALTLRSAAGPAGPTRLTGGAIPNTLTPLPPRAAHAIPLCYTTIGDPAHPPPLLLTS